jgi:hypothetical protein
MKKTETNKSYAAVPLSKLKLHPGERNIFPSLLIRKERHVAHVSFHTFSRLSGESRETNRNIFF